jgi:four helix bundle protein
MGGNLIRERSYRFALRIVRLFRALEGRREFILSRQVLRSGTSIGANVEEATAAQSRRDFIAKMAIASKEARECNYWLRLLRDARILPATRLQPLIDESDELIRILTAIVKSTRNP